MDIATLTAAYNEWVEIAKCTDAMTEEDHRVCVDLVDQISKLSNVKDYTLVFVSGPQEANDLLTRYETVMDYYTDCCDAISNNNMEFLPKAMVDVKNALKACLSPPYYNIPIFFGPVSKRRQRPSKKSDLYISLNRSLKQLNDILLFHPTSRYRQFGIHHAFGAKFHSDTSEVAKLCVELRKHCGTCLFHHKLCIIVDRPASLSIENRDGWFVFHNENGPSYVSRNGTEKFHIHGMDFPAKVVMAPETITLTEIKKEINTERRRVLMERYGFDRLLRDCKATLANEEIGIGKLYRTRLGNDRLTMIEVVNSTPEPDGSFKKYWLRVPPNMKTAREAVAWTFGKTEAEYHPEVET